MRQPLAWLLYWLGDLASKVLHRIPDDWERGCDIGYTIYNKLMVASMKVQGDGKGLWSPLAK